MIRKYVVLICLLASFLFGALFAYFPVENTHYAGPNQVIGICDGSQVLIPHTPGYVRRGVPIVNRNSLVMGSACPTETSFSHGDWDVDVAVGLTVGFGISYGIYMLTRKPAKPAKRAAAKKTRKSKK